MEATDGKTPEEEIKRGIEVEREHRDTAKKVLNGEIKTEEEIYKSIAEDHLKEDPQYYMKLQKANLESKTWEEK